MKKKKILVLLGVICLFISFGIITYAYFIKKIEGGTHGISSSPDDSQVVNVANFNELTQAVRLYDSNDSEYNSSSDVSDSTRRKTIKFVDNIKLKSDLLIDADCHINLNEFTLDLNGHDITFRYRFDGLYFIYGGTIDDSTILDEEGNLIENAVPGTIIIDCPKQNLEFDNSIIKENTNIQVVYATDEQIAISAMNMVLSNIQDIGINDFYNIKDTIDSVSHYGCDFTHNDGTMCIYTITDLDLINNYFNYEELSITYSSSNKQVLSDSGNVTVATSTQTSDLTITVSYNGCEPVSKVVSVHVLGTNEDYLKTSNLLLQKYLSRYYDADTNTLKFSTSFLLPKMNDYLGVAYIYELITTTSGVISSDDENEFFDSESYGDYYLAALTSDITGIRITSTKGEDYITTETIPVSGKSTTVIDDNHSYAVNIARTLYNNQIFIEKDKNSDNYTEYGNILMDPNEYGYTRIESISNRLVNNDDETYELIDHPELTSKGEENPKYNKYQILRVNEESEIKPYVGQTVFLEITFKFKEYYDGDIVVVQVPIIFKPHEESGQNFPAFDPFYTYFNKEFSKASSNYGYESFSMPLSYDGDPVNPIYTFVVFEKVDGAYKKVITDLFNFSYGENNSQLSFDKNTLTSITINPKHIKQDTQEYYFAYIPTYLNTEGTEVYYYDYFTKSKDNTVDTIVDEIESNSLEGNNYPYMSVLTIPGIVRFGENEAFLDEDFYIMAYNLLSYDTYEEGKYLLSSDLENYVSEIDFSSMETFELNSTDTAGKINSLKGIDLMKGINVLDFHDKTLTSSADFAIELGYVSQITNLKILNLANTGIYDCTQSNIAMPNNNNNNFMSALTQLINLEELYLQNNKIFYFSELSNFAVLKKVDISGNSFTATTGLDFLNTPLTNLSNSLYGTFGANNVGAVTMLKSKDVEVIQGTTTDQELQQEFIDIVSALSSLQYQDRLDSLVDINDVLELYPSGDKTNTDICNIYKLPQSFVLTTNDDISFKFDTLNFVANANGDGFVMQIVYDWEQIGLFGQDGEVQFNYEYKVSRY